MDDVPIRSSSNRVPKRRLTPVSSRDQATGHAGRDSDSLAQPAQPTSRTVGYGRARCAGDLSATVPEVLRVGFRHSTRYPTHSAPVGSPALAIWAPIGVHRRSSSKSVAPRSTPSQGTARRADDLGAKLVQRHSSTRSVAPRSTEPARTAHRSGDSPWCVPQHRSQMGQEGGWAKLVTRAAPATFRPGASRLPWPPARSALDGSPKRLRLARAGPCCPHRIRPRHPVARAGCRHALRADSSR